jgi:hypothetical protein
LDAVRLIYAPLTLQALQLAGADDSLWQPAIERAQHELGDLIRVLGCRDDGAPDLFL